jgi:hypothetical protein
MFRSKRTKAIDTLATEIIRAVQWYPIPVTIRHVAEQVQTELGRVGVNVSLLEACRRTEKVYRRMSK